MDSMVDTELEQALQRTRIRKRRRRRMHLPTFFAVAFGLTTSVAAVQNPHKKAEKFAKRSEAIQPKPAASKKRQTTSLNSKTEKYAVNGTAIPEVGFDIGESYAGTLSISGNASDENALYFWYFPTDNEAAGDEIVIWLNGGPGCSSLDGLFQENGPFLWQSGTYSPIENPWSWTNVTNMVWIDQPVGTGFSPAAEGVPATIKNEKDVAEDFMGFWKNFMETFDLVGRKVYLTGESYAGQYIPYIAHYMLEANNTDYFNVSGIQINDPSINEDSVMIYSSAVQHLNKYASVFALNETFMTEINERAEKCGYFEFMDYALNFPPITKLPSGPNISAPGCYVWDDIVTAAITVNPCFNFYHLTDFCPYLWDELGFPSLGWGPNNYFNRSDVQKAINAPPTSYAICGNDNLGLDSSIPSALGPLPSVIERTNNVILGHGWLDYLLLANGSLATIQNMTWNGAQGFQSPPTDKFVVPSNPGLDEVINAVLYQGSIPEEPVGIVTGAGVMGTTHTERGLTFVTVDLAGHEIPQYVPGAGYRQLEFLLGRIPSLTYEGGWSTGNGTGAFAPLGNSTMRRV
ncbi:alpha/beta-hydrolase [Hortaea werneckii]|nr:alpha/beta-hydrolase [Hortaea werneckii]KAI7495807.1 alpha/beta-hydrolase [Hortaea werneckii]